ncbi:hypothetical protein ACFQPG_11550 [Sphingomonas sp. GCM10030256]|uniref:hypothetical protein n=1 Tax=Sphingomonas sp. GCM10030256 TaxID=3273427 RepID=UPI00360771E3
MRDAGDDNDLMWEGWILNPDGTIHAAEVVATAVLPAPRDVKVRLHYAFTREEALAGKLRWIQLQFDAPTARSLAHHLLESSEKTGRT